MIYTKEEADQKGMQYVPWREAQTGQWGLTDDLFVAQCIKRCDYRTGTMFVYPFGRPWASMRKPLVFWDYYQKGSYNYAVPQTWAEAEAAKTRTERTVQAFAAMILAGKKPDWKVLGAIYRPNQRIPEATVRRLFRREEIKTMVTEEMKNLLQSKGITKDSVLDLYMRAAKIGEDNDDAKALIQVADRLADLLDMVPVKGKKVVQLEQFGAEIFGEIGKGVQQARLAQQTITTTEPIEGDSDGSSGVQDRGMGEAERDGQ